MEIDAGLALQRTGRGHPAGWGPAGPQRLWLSFYMGHRSPATTQYYVRITPTKLAKAYSDAGYFARNLRAIEVLVDRDAVQRGAAAAGEPWQYFDLGHGYCTYSFFEQCQHRMACARCDFYVPKSSTRSQLLEARTNLQRMLVEIPLLDEERAAVEEGQSAVDRLLERLADVPTPAGPTPRQIASRQNLKLLPSGQSLSRSRRGAARSTMNATSVGNLEMGAGTSAKRSKQGSLSARPQLTPQNL